MPKFRLVIEVETSSEDQSGVVDLVMDAIRFEAEVVVDTIVKDQDAEAIEQRGKEFSFYAQLLEVERTK